MKLVTFDTSILISYKPPFPKFGFLMSAVVLQEMTAGAADNSELKRWRDTYLAFKRAERLLVPTADDWWGPAEFSTSYSGDLNLNRAGGRRAFRPRRSSGSSVMC